MKCIHKAHLSNPKTYRNTKFERFVLTHVHHPFLTAMQAAFEDARFVYFVMECATGGNIYSFIYRKSPRVQEFVLLGEIAIRFIAATIVLAL